MPTLDGQSLLRLIESYMIPGARMPANSEWHTLRGHHPMRTNESPMPPMRSKLGR
jgi:hypothetical protein